MLVIYIVEETLLDFFANFVSKSRLQRNFERIPIRINLAINFFIDYAQSIKQKIAKGQFEKYKGSPPYAHFGTWKKPCYMKSPT